MEDPIMSQFAFIFRGGGIATSGLSPSEMQAHMSKWQAWVKVLADTGHHRGGQPLQNGGKVVRGRERVVTDGPFAESKDLVTGSLMIEAASLEMATELAHGCPIFEFGGSVEVRPIREM
jgi:hypothetical protein